ncbi:MAG: 6-bladed beta-propeller [Balneolaceae bacterium]
MSNAVGSIFAKYRFYNTGFLLMFLIYGCGESNTKTAFKSPVELTEYKTLLSYEENVLGDSAIIRYVEDAGLYIYDQASATIVLIDDEFGEIINNFGRSGQGPGEFIRVTNLFFSEEYLFAVDVGRLLIHKYDMAGNFTASFEFSPPSNMGPPPPPLPPLEKDEEEFVNLIRAYGSGYSPYVLPDKTIILRRAESNQHIFKLSDWEGTEEGDFVKTPEEYRTSNDIGVYRREVSGREIPSNSKFDNFIVIDKSNDSGVFLVYSSISKIAKYQIEQGKEWETEVEYIPEFDSIQRLYFETAEEILGITDMFLPNKVYWSGSSNCKGQLYLSTFNYNSKGKELLIHRFSPKGELMDRYQFKDGDKLMPVFDVDCDGEKLFFVTENAEVVSYLIK